MGELWRCEETDEEAWLLGQPPLNDYLDFLRHEAVATVDGRPDNQVALVDEWRAAGERYQALEESEAGIASEVECRELDPAIAPLVEELRADRRFRRTFRWLPTTLALVQLDRLIVSQKSVTWSFVEQLATRLSASP